MDSDIGSNMPAQNPLDDRLHFLREVEIPFERSAELGRQMSHEIQHQFIDPPSIEIDDGEQRFGVKIPNGWYGETRKCVGHHTSNPIAEHGWPPFALVLL